MNVCALLPAEARRSGTRRRRLVVSLCLCLRHGDAERAFSPILFAISSHAYVATRTHQRGVQLTLAFVPRRQSVRKPNVKPKTLYRPKIRAVPMLIDTLYPRQHTAGQTNFPGCDARRIVLRVRMRSQVFVCIPKYLTHFASNALIRGNRSLQWRWYRRPPAQVTVCAICLFWPVR